MPYKSVDDVWRSRPEGKTGNGGLLEFQERLLSTPSTVWLSAAVSLLVWQRWPRELFPPTLSGLSPQPSSTLSNLLTLWSRAERTQCSQSAANDAKQVGARSEWSHSRLSKPTALLSSIHSRDLTRSLHCFLLKIRAGTMRTDVALWHPVKATGILTQFLQLNNSWWGRLVFKEQENHHTSVSGCYSIRATWELDGNFASWVHPQNLHLTRSPTTN